MNWSNPFGLDLQAHKLPFVGGFFENPDEKFQRQQMHNMANAYGAYRPEAAQARMNALSNQFSLYQPVANTMASMYGPGAVPNTSQAMVNPMSPRMMAIGNPRSGGFAPQAMMAPGTGGPGPSAAPAAAPPRPMPMNPTQDRGGPPRRG